MEFRARLASANGEITEGVFAADSESRLRRELEEKGLYVLSLQAKGGVPGLSANLLSRRPSVPSSEFLVFNQELATLLKAGMPLVQSLDLLKRRVVSPAFKAILDDVYEKVKAGTALSDAFAAQGNMFPSVYTASLLAGERSGNLDAMLRRFVEYTKVVATLKRKTISALIYPAVLITLATVLVGIIMVMVFPAFADIYETYDADLPLLTRVLIGSSDFIRGQFMLILVGLAAAIAVALVWVRQPGQKARLDRIMLSLPMVGPVASKFATSQMSRTLATLLGGGLPLVNAIDIAARSVGNQYIAGQLDIVAARGREGESFALALERRGAFPDVAVKMAEVGESNGGLQEMLNTVADFYDEEIATSMERFITLVEPVMLVIMGVVIAVLLLALYMPLIQIYSVLSE